MEATMTQPTPPPIRETQSAPGPDSRDVIAAQMQQASDAAAATHPTYTDQPGSAPIQQVTEGPDRMAADANPPAEPAAVDAREAPDPAAVQQMTTGIAPNLPTPNQA
jgi:hypothetical protein